MHYHSLITLNVITLIRCSYWANTLYASTGSPKDNGNLGRIVGAKQMQRLVELLENHGGEVIYGGNYEMKDRCSSPLNITLLSALTHPNTVTLGT